MKSIADQMKEAYETNGKTISIMKLCKRFNQPYNPDKPDDGDSLTVHYCTDGSKLLTRRGPKNKFQLWTRNPQP